MRALLALVWLAGLAASAWAAWRGWRGSRPFDVIRVRGAFGYEQITPRWSVWAPTAVLAISGLAILRQPADPPGLILFFLIWCGAIVYMSAHSALTLMAARDRT